jgi:hypothetical protein
MQSPNLFNPTTIERSQDAFIGWLASWANPAFQAKYDALRATATAFLERLIEVGKVPKPPEYRTIEVRQQWENIDALLLVNDDTAIIIEDKINARDHSDQLQRYTTTVDHELPSYRIPAVYLKTGDQCDYQSAEQAGYGCFLRSDFLEILERGKPLGIRNDIFCDFYRYLYGIEESVRGFLTITPQKWECPQWKGFFMALKKKPGDGEWANRGHPGGGSLTFRWHCRKDKYLGLGKDKLFFSIAVKDESQQEAKRSEWNKMLLAKNGTTGIRIRLSRLRLGKRMKVAELDGDYCQTNDQRLLDFDRTVDVLKNAEKLMDAALEVGTLFGEVVKIERL